MSEAMDQDNKEFSIIDLRYAHFKHFDWLLYIFQSIN